MYQSEFLNKLRIASPCSAAWNAMPGDNRVRFCSRCRLRVYNLSAMSAREAVKLVREREGSVCVRFYCRADGTVITRDCRRRPLPIRPRFVAIAAALGGFAAMLLGLVIVAPPTWKENDYGKSLSQIEPFRTVIDVLFPSQRTLMGEIRTPPPRANAGAAGNGQQPDPDETDPTAP